MQRLEVKITAKSEQEVMRCLEEVQRNLMRGYKQGGGPYNTYGTYTFRLKDVHADSSLPAPSNILHH